MHAAHTRANLLLVITATIWGLAFVAQRLGMEHMGPYGFNAARFALGAVSLLPVMYFFEWRKDAIAIRRQLPKLLQYGSLCGLCLFGGASFQQVGLQYTTAGNAGFITGLYIVLIPVVGLFTRQPSSRETWLGASLAAMGLYLLSVTENFTLAYGDLLELLGAFFWAAHVLLIGRFSPKVPPLALSIVQFMLCAIASGLVALLTESNTLSGLTQASWAIFYAGLMSVGIAYTLQVVAQRNAHPAHAALIMSLEAVFAAIGGWLFLSEMLSTRGLIGCGLMLTGCVLAQVKLFRIPDHALNTKTT
ncbi:MAG: DMT family transporter [Hahellaceae bacterium]|nr:DMT family transporter [Hahellaceae bacterium]